MSTKTPSTSNDGLKPAVVKRAANIVKGGETLAVIMFEGDAKVYLGSTSGRTASDHRAFILQPGDKVRYKTLTGSAIIDTVEIVID